MGLHHVYVGNVHDRNGQTTYCPNCQRSLIERDWHRILRNDLTKGTCPDCQTKIAGIFHPDSPDLIKVGANWEEEIKA
jgi:pyruvate formate lyase activating enzyme